MPPAQVPKKFIDQHRNACEVALICKVSEIVPWGYRRQAAYKRNPDVHCARSRAHNNLKSKNRRLGQANKFGYSAEMVWKQFNRERITVARRKDELLMKRLGLRGVLRVSVGRAKVPDTSAPRLMDRGNRQFSADRPNQICVSNVTYVSTWQG